jgi:hypothetical protein
VWDPFAQEIHESDAEFHREEDIRELQFEMMAGVYHHSSQVKRSPLNNCPTSLLIGNFVAVAQSESDDPSWPKSSLKGGVRVGLITNLIVREPPQIEVEWYGSGRSNVLARTKWKVCTSRDRVAIIPMYNIITTWDLSGFTPSMKIRRLYLDTIAYKLKLKHSGEKDWSRAKVRDFIPAEMDDPEDLSEYMEGDDVRGKAGRGKTTSLPPAIRAKWLNMLNGKPPSSSTSSSSSNERVRFQPVVSDDSDEEGGEGQDFDAAEDEWVDESKNLGSGVGSVTTTNIVYTTRRGSRSP